MSVNSIFTREDVRSIERDVLRVLIQDPALSVQDLNRHCLKVLFKYPCAYYEWLRARSTPVEESSDDELSNVRGGSEFPERDLSPPPLAPFPSATAHEVGCAHDSDAELDGTV